MNPNYATILQANVRDVIKMVEKDGWSVVTIAYGLAHLIEKKHLAANCLSIYD